MLSFFFGGVFVTSCMHGLVRNVHWCSADPKRATTPMEAGPLGNPCSCVVSMKPNYAALTSRRRSSPHAPQIQCFQHTTKFAHSRGGGCLEACVAAACAVATCRVLRTSTLNLKPPQGCAPRGTCSRCACGTTCGMLRTPSSPTRGTPLAPSAATCTCTDCTFQYTC